MIDVEIKGLEETQRAMEQIVRDLRGEPFLSGMRRATLLVQRSAKQKAPVDTGRLRASITPLPPEPPMICSNAGVFNSETESKSNAPCS